MYSHFGLVDVRQIPVLLCESMTISSEEPVVVSDRFVFSDWQFVLPAEILVSVQKRLVLAFKNVVLIYESPTFVAKLLVFF